MSITQRLIEDPKIAERIRDLVEKTGIPLEQYVAWLESDPPPGIDRDTWTHALADAAKAPPISAEALEALRRMVAPTLHAKRADRAA
ncbi:hypothetical protein [Nocardiopsis synnemataformans]|uniref:hypothetical protein n=1 Tax=Nocardiopsis synnemataformans TaxID=61305 RepID=UPI003EBB728E